MKEMITLSRKELDRVSVIQSTIKKRVRQYEAARQLGLSVRQIKRLARRYREAGATGLVSGHRGQPSNHAIRTGLYPAQGGHHRMRGLRRERDPAVPGSVAPVPPA